MKEENEFGNDLIIPKKETMLTRFFKWVVRAFSRSEEKTLEEMAATRTPNITVPKAVRMPEEIKEIEDFENNSLEHLYKMSDDELDHLDGIYDEQMEENKKEIERLNGILQSYTNAIKDIQTQISEE